MPAKKLVSDDEVKSIVQQYQQGSNISSLASTFSYDRGTIRRILNEADVKIRKTTGRPGGVAPSTVAITPYVLHLYIEEFLPISKVAQRFDVNEATIRRILKENGVTTRTGTEQKRLRTEEEKAAINATISIAKGGTGKPKVIVPKKIYVSREKICEYCGELFIIKPVSPKQKFCSSQCRTHASRKDRICPCGKSFWNGPAMENNEKFCSSDCRIEYSQTNSSPEIRKIKLHIQNDTWTNIPNLMENATTRSKDCWVWPYTNKTGYGIIQVELEGKNKPLKTHRIMMRALNGGIDVDGVVHHKCANRACCNPDHLQVTTHAENTAEMLERAGYNQVINHQAARIAELEAKLALLAN